MDEWTYRIATALCDGVGPKTYHVLSRKVEAKGLGFADLFALDEMELMREFGVTASVAEKIVTAVDGVEDVAAMREGLMERGIEILVSGMPGYPEKCAIWMEDSAPPLIYAMGPLDLLDAKGIGIVGSRDASEAGLAAARAIGSRVVGDGAVVVSGFASGIDTHGHLGALEAGGGTIACLPDGIEHFRMRPELADVSENGSILALSQHPPRRPWSTGGAMSRNVVVCALSDTIVVVEAQLGGGTMHAAETAREMGKPVFTVALEPLPDGNRSLIRTGAPAIEPTDPIDVTELLSASAASPDGAQATLF
jgi:DNA processing protein